MKKLRKD